MRIVCTLLLAVACTSDDTGETEETDDTEPVGFAPSARCSVEPALVLRGVDTAMFDGSDSDDEDGDIASFTWAWSSRPDGSVAELTGTDSLTPDPFLPDLPGEYVLGLTVVDDDGLVDSCNATLVATDAANLEIDLTWTEAGDDLDIHLILGDAEPADPLYDCFYQNCPEGAFNEIDWGDPGDDDDPVLVADDIEGTGPEIIEYAHPLPETYRVVVHDYPNASGEFPGNLATVTISIDSVVVWSDTRTVGAEGAYQEFALIDWPALTVDGL